MSDVRPDGFAKVLRVDSAVCQSRREDEHGPHGEHGGAAEAGQWLLVETSLVRARAQSTRSPITSNRSRPLTNRTSAAVIITSSRMTSVVTIPVTFL